MYDNECAPARGRGADGLTASQVIYDIMVCAVGEMTATFGVPGVMEHCYFMKASLPTRDCAARMPCLLAPAERSDAQRERTVSIASVCHSLRGPGLAERHVAASCSSGLGGADSADGYLSQKLHCVIQRRSSLAQLMRSL